MTLTTELVDGARFVKLNGITRFIWFRRVATRERQFSYERGILVIAALGFCVVFAPWTVR